MKATVDGKSYRLERRPADAHNPTANVWDLFREGPGGEKFLTQVKSCEPSGWQTYFGQTGSLEQTIRTVLTSFRAAV